jgi:hypothetical protein
VDELTRKSPKLLVLIHEELVVFEDSGHMTYVEEDAKYLSIIRNFTTNIGSNLMKRKIHVYFAFIVLLSITQACNLQTSAKPTLSVDDQAATIIAQTLQAGNENGGDMPFTATFSTMPQATSTHAPTATITPTYSLPMLTVQESTNCRSGPGQDYEVVFTYLQGKKLEIVGHYPQENYWLVKSAESSTGECWLWGEYAEVTGSYWVVSSVTPPATPTIPPPLAPAVTWEFNCDYNTNQLDVSFTWTDNATNEAGYRVIRNDQAVVELPANTTAYTDTYLFDSGERVVYQIEAYNVTGSTRSSVISVTC